MVILALRKYGLVFSIALVIADLLIGTWLLSWELRYLHELWRP